MASRPTAPRGPSIVNVLPEPTPTVTSSGSATRSVRDTSLLTYSLPCPSPSGRRQARPRSRRARRTRRAAQRGGGGRPQTHAHAFRPSTARHGTDDHHQWRRRRRARFDRRTASSSRAAIAHRSGSLTKENAVISKQETQRRNETKQKAPGASYVTETTRLLHLDEHDITLHYIIHCIVL